MGRGQRGFVGLAMAGLVGAVGSGLVAQEPASVMTAERSYAIQRQLQAAEANRAAFVNQLFLKWNPYVDNAQYDLWEELEPIAMRAPAWQLYAASLVGDFETMTRLLMGLDSPSRYINAISEPQPLAAAGTFGGTVEPQAFGDTNDQLVFTPIQPCRVVDTRPGPGGSGARTGVLADGATRSFDLESDAFTAGQGVSGPCTGLPNFSYLAWAVNVTVTGYGGVGGLKAWGFGGTEPNASIINYSSSIAPAVANGLILTGCYACSDDITVKTFGSATHIIIDVIGYFAPAGIANASTTRVAGTTTTVGAGSFTFVTGGACPAGTTLIGGELDFLTGGNVMVGEIARVSSTQMRFWAVNQDGGSNNAVAYSVCQDTPIRIQ